MMNKQNNHDSFSYYRLSLLSFLKESHPKKVSESDFINSRSDSASEVYSEAIKSGIPHLYAHELAMEALYRGLHFSKHDTIVNIIWNEFEEQIPSSQAINLASKIQPYCEPILSKYELSDSFSFSPEFEILYTELVGTIDIWLEENGYGLQ